MNLLNFFQRRNTAPVARERDLVALLREEILAVVARHVPVEPEKVQVRMERGKVMSTLEIEVEIPGVPKLLVANG